MSACQTDMLHDELLRASFALKTELFLFLITLFASVTCDKDKSNKYFFFTITYIYNCVNNEKWTSRRHAGHPWVLAKALPEILIHRGSF